MIYRFFIPSSMKKSVEDMCRKCRNPQIKTIIEDYLKSEQQLLNADDIKRRIWLMRHDIHGGLRIVWREEEQKKGITIYVLRYIKLHNEYMKDDLYSIDFQLTQDEKEELDTFVQEIKQERERPQLPIEYQQYEGQRTFIRHRDAIYYEMPLWRDGIRKVPKDYWTEIQERISQIFEREGEFTIKQCDVFQYININGGYTVTFRYGDQHHRGDSDIFLLKIAEGNEPNLTELIEFHYDCPDVNNLKKFSSKCYPDYFTYEYKAWKDIEEDDVANLALSDEEINILQNENLPFFVSGQAGSGKSTILYYQYANIYSYVAKHYPEHRLLFLSYNETLVNKARMSVKAILTNNTEIGIGTDYFTNEKNKTHFEQSFVPFRDFLVTNFLDDTSINRFKEENHINYDRFCKLYQEECFPPAGSQLSPAILWSVIRTFIKGRSLQYFTPEDYASDQVVRNDRTVDQSVYKKAYRLWENWYRHYAEKGILWDDLDLVRYVLEKGEKSDVFHNYAVIFCDEAQDFTKLEINLLLRLSKHSEYMLCAGTDDEKIPIAFAGDPNQTISPTGFRWAGTKAIFNEAFSDSLSNYARLGTPELSINYRSQLGIVKFANSIQSIRYKYFDDTPQNRRLQGVREEPNGDNNTSFGYVGFYSYTQHKEVILQNLGNANIITSGDGEYGDRDAFPEIIDDNVTLLTAIGTKGLEYNAVMLLNFCNDSNYRSFQKIVSGQGLTDDSERFQLAHFFTKLYIAISRARNQLFIIDTDEAYENFWKYFTEFELWENLMGSLAIDDTKKKLVGHLSQGDIHSLPQRLSETYDAEENGRQAFAKAIGDHSASLMEKAKKYFTEAHLSASADECDAYILLYEGQYEAAGDKFAAFRQQDKFAEAAKSYWKGSCWQKYSDIYIQRHDVDSSDEIRHLACRFMTDKIDIAEFVKILAEKEDNFQNALQSHLGDRLIWHTLFEKVHQQLNQLSDERISNQLLEDLDQIAKYIKWFEGGLAGVRAEMHFKRARFINEGFKRNSERFKPEEYERAIEIWEEIEDISDNKQYFESKKILSTSSSEMIRWMWELKEMENIVRDYGNNESVSILNLSEEAQNIIFQCWLRRDYLKAIGYPYPNNATVKWNRLYQYDKLRFLTDVILNDFNLEKYYYLEDRVKQEPISLFEENNINKEIFHKIFSLTEWSEEKRPYWIYFVSQLKNGNGERILKKVQSRDSILESLSNLLVSREQKDKETIKAYATCFLEFLFDREYNAHHSDRYRSTIVKIFDDDIFFKNDFRLAQGRNRYFTAYIDVNPKEIDELKENIGRYVEYFLSRAIRVKRDNATEVKAIFRAFEVCSPYQEINIGDKPTYAPDFNAISEMYKKYSRDSRFEFLKDWMRQRRLFAQMMDALMNQKAASFAEFADKIKEKQGGIEAFIGDLHTEDAAMLMASALSCGDDYSYENTLLLAEQVYKFRLRRGDMKSYYTDGTYIFRKYEEWIDKAIEHVLSDEKRIDDYALKILAYSWEALYSDEIAAKHYDQLLNESRVKKAISVTDYLKRRALLKYNDVNGDIFKEKQKEYGLQLERQSLPPQVSQN